MKIDRLRSIDQLDSRPSDLSVRNSFASLPLHKNLVSGRRVFALEIYRMPKYVGNESY